MATFAPNVFPAAFRLHGDAVASYFEAAAVITVLVLLGQMLAKVVLSLVLVPPLIALGVAIARRLDGKAA